MPREACAVQLHSDQSAQSDQCSRVPDGNSAFRAATTAATAGTAAREDGSGDFDAAGEIRLLFELRLDEEVTHFNLENCGAQELGFTCTERQAISIGSASDGMEDSDTIVGNSSE